MAETRILEMRSVLMTFRSEKRQFRNVSSSNPISVDFSANHSVPVSYTHLDVYKRQPSGGAAVRFVPVEAKEAKGFKKYTGKIL